MSVIDEKQEAIACIRMAVDNDNLARLHSDAPGPDNEDIDLQHHQLGSPDGKKSNLRVMSAELGKVREEYRSLDEKVRDFVATQMPEEALRYEEDIHVSLHLELIYIFYVAQIQRYQCISLKYQSKVDWTATKDIMRCNPNFHGQTRFDCVIIHDDAPGITCARLNGLLRCWLPSGNVLDLALVLGFTPSKWKPRTLWQGCRILDEDSNGDSYLVRMDYLLRGALICPVSEQDGERTYYFIDTVDSDMFLRENFY